MNQKTRKLALFLLRAYKFALSPLLPPSCRYIPTCSDYAMEAVERYGALRGGVKAMGRLLRCHPFVAGGYDPVVKPAEMKFAADFRDVTPNAPPNCCAVTE